MTDQSSFAFDAFISCCPTDRRWVDTFLLPRLHAHGLQVVITPGTQSLDAVDLPLIERSIQQARYTFAILSPAALSDPKATFERDLAQALGYQEQRIRLIPILIAPLMGQRLPTRLAQLATVDFTQPDKVEDMFAYLIASVQEP
jgi:hypothetical protein